MSDELWLELTRAVLYPVYTPAEKQQLLRWMRNDFKRRSSRWRDDGGNPAQGV